MHFNDRLYLYISVIYCITLGYTINNNFFNLLLYFNKPYLSINGSLYNFFFIFYYWIVKISKNCFNVCALFYTTRSFNIFSIGV